MNILVYNFFDESCECFDPLLRRANSSVYFAISLTDVLRLLRDNRIDKAIMRLDDVPDQLISEITSKHKNTEFYISSERNKESKLSNISYLPYNIKLNTINLYK